MIEYPELGAEMEFTPRDDDGESLFDERWEAIVVCVDKENNRIAVYDSTNDTVNILLLREDGKYTSVIFEPPKEPWES